MRKINFIIIMSLLQIVSFACPVCERNKPKILRGITHGSSPDSNWDYVIVFAMIVIAIATLFYSIKWLINPKEKNGNHIKYSFLTEQ